MQFSIPVYIYERTCFFMCSKFSQNVNCQNTRTIVLIGYLIAVVEYDAVLWCIYISLLDMARAVVLKAIFVAIQNTHSPLKTTIDCSNDLFA